MANQRKISTGAVVWAVILVSAANAQSPEILVDVDRQEIYEGESVVYRVVLNHIQDPEAPTIVPTDDFDVQFLGERSLDSQRITIINGVRNQIIRRGREYTYRLTPLRSGRVVIPAPSAVVEGKRLDGREIVINVAAPDDQDVVLLEITADHQAVYPMQPFEITLTLLVKQLPDQLGDRDPLSVQPQPPALVVPWLDDDQIPDGMEASETWREVLEPYVSRSGNGVQINQIRNSSVMSFFQREATGFRPAPRRVTRPGENGDEVSYWAYDFRRRFLPRKLGTYRFGPVSLKGTFAVGFENGQLVGDQLYAVADPLEIVVRDVPLAGRPESYIGAVGEFEVGAQIAPQTVRVGDPMTLSITLQGVGTLDHARPPAIDQLADVRSSFRTHDATEESATGKRIFVYSLRPLSKNVTEFPSVPIAYFDVNQQNYVTLNTPPIPVTVREAESLSGGDIVAASSSAVESSDTLQTREDGLFGNETDWKSIRDETVRPGRWLGFWSAMIIGTFVLAAGVQYTRRVREDPALMRRRGASVRAQALLDEARTQLAAGDVRVACESLRRAVTGLIADFANIPEGGLTPRDAATALESLGVEAELCRSVDQFLSACDEASYGSAVDVVPELEHQARQLIRELIAGSRKRFNAPVSALVVISLLGLSGCSAKPNLETLRRLELAEETFANAQSPDDYARSATQYQSVVDGGLQSAAAFYNQGNAWMRAGQRGRAIAAYRQAQRFRPRDPYLDANLRQALGGQGDVGLQIGLPGYVMFWQNWLSYPEKFWVTSWALTVSLVAFLLALITRRYVGFRRLGILCLCLTCLFGISTAWDWYRFDCVSRGVVVNDKVTARKGNSESYDAAFTEPLAQGVEFVLLGRRDDWLHVRIGDRNTAWISEQDAVVF